MRQRVTSTQFPMLVLSLIGIAVISACDQEGAWDQRIDAAFDPSACPAAPEVILDESDYSGPLIDTHFHIPHLPDSPPGLIERDYSEVIKPVLGKNITMNDIVCTLEQEGTARAFAFFPVFPEVDPRFPLEVADRAITQHPTMVIPFIMPRGPHDVPPTVDSVALRGMLEAVPGLFRGYGEIGLYELKGRSGSNDYPPDAPIFQRIYPIASEHNLIVYLHPGKGHRVAFERILSEHPEIDFIVHGEQIENEIGTLMGKYPNVYFTVNDLYGDQYLLNIGENKATFLAAVNDFEPLLAKDLSTWKDLIEAHPDQFVWGTDRGDAVWTFDREVGQRLVAYARAFIGRLDPDVQERFAYKNAERLVFEAEAR